MGMYVTEAREKSIPVRTIAVPMHEVDRAMVDGEEEGFVKTHIEEGTDRILGATVVARHAGEMISSFPRDYRRNRSASTGPCEPPLPDQAAAIKMAANVVARAHPSRFRVWFAKKWLAYGLHRPIRKATG